MLVGGNVLQSGSREFCRIAIRETLPNLFQGGACLSQFLLIDLRQP
jgi:hypothetical protein